MKKGITLWLLTILLVMGIVSGCSDVSQTSANASNSAAGTADATNSGVVETAATVTDDTEKVTVGYIGWSYTDNESRTYIRLLDYAAEVCGFEMVYAVFASMEDIIEQAEILIEGGADAIIALVVTPPLLDLCASHGVYVMQYASAVTDENLKGYLEQSEYWIGYSNEDNEGAGAGLISTLYDGGCRNILLCAAAPGMVNQDIRYDSAVAKAAEYSDLNLFTWRATSDWTSEITDAVINNLTMYPEIDGIATIGGVEGICESVIQAMDNCGVLGSVKYTLIDIVDNTSEYLQNGYIYACAGTSLQAIVFEAITLQNAALGCDWDFPVGFSTSWIWMTTSEEYEEYKTYVCGEECFPFSEEDYQSISYNYNKECSFEMLTKMATMRTLEEYIALAG